MPATTAPLLRYTATVGERALVMSLATPDASTVVAVENDLKKHPGVGDTMTGLHVALANVAETLARDAPNLSREGFIKAARAAIDREVRPKFQLLQESAHRAFADVDRRWSDLLKPRSAEQSVPAVRAEQRAFARSLSLPKLLDAVKADSALAAAIVEGGVAMSGLPIDVFERLRREMAVTQLAERLQEQHAYRTQPTADDPIAGKPDLEAARKAAEQKIADIEDERDMLGRIAPLLSSVVTATALMTGETLQAAFTRLSA